MRNSPEEQIARFARLGRKASVPLFLLTRGFKAPVKIKDFGGQQLLVGQNPKGPSARETHAVYMPRPATDPSAFCLLLSAFVQV